MFKLLIRAACLLGVAVSGPPAASLAAEPPAEGWAAPHLILALPVFVSLRLRCPSPQTTACVLVEPEGGWTPDPEDGRRVLREPFLLDLAVEEPFARGRFTFALPLNEDRSAVRFALGDGAPFDVPSRRQEAQSFACFPVPDQRVGRVLAECVVVSPVDGVRFGGEAGTLTGRRGLAGPTQPTPFPGKEPADA